MLDLGPAPSRALDLTPKSYTDGPNTIAATAAGQWVRFARVTLPAVGDGGSASIRLTGAPDANNAVDVIDMKVRAGQRSAFGTAPASDVVLARSTSALQTDIGYVVVQSTSPSIVDFYVRLLIVGRRYHIEMDAATSGTGTIAAIDGSAGSTTAPTGLVTASVSADTEYSTASKAMFSIAPPVGSWDVPAGILPNTGTGVAQTTGRMYIQPWVIGPSGFTVDQAAVRMSTPQSGGTTTAVVAIYGSDQYGLIDTTQRIAVSNSFVLTTAGTTITATFPTPPYLPPGLYWIAYLYVQTAAPTTQALVVGITNSTWALPNLSGIVGTAVRGYYLNAAQTTPPNTAIAFNSTLWTQTAAGDVPQIMLRRSA